MGDSAWRTVKSWNPRAEKHGHWEYFGTLTFAKDHTRASAERVFRRWASEVAVQSGHFVLFYTNAPQKSGRPHVHFVASFNPDFESPDATDLEGRWKAGRAEVDDFDSEQGGMAYIFDHGNLDFHIACPRKKRCRRKRGCRFILQGDFIKK